MRPLAHHSPEQEATSEGVTSVTPNLLSVINAVRTLDTHLRRDVLIKVPCILWVTELRDEGRLHPVDIVPVDSFEPRMRLRLVSRSRIPGHREQPQPGNQPQHTRFAVVRRRITGRWPRFGSRGGEQSRADRGIQSAFVHILPLWYRIHATSP